MKLPSVGESKVVRASEPAVDSGNDTVSIVHCVVCVDDKHVYTT